MNYFVVRGYTIARDSATDKVPDVELFTKTKVLYIHIILQSLNGKWLEGCRFPLHTTQTTIDVEETGSQPVPSSSNCDLSMDKNIVVSNLNEQRKEFFQELIVLDKQISITTN